jgi:hypothetical protein
MPIASKIALRHLILPEILADQPMSTPIRTLTIPNQRLETLPPPFTLRLRRLAMLIQILRHPICGPIPVFARVIHDMYTRFPIPPRPPRLLIEPLEALRDLPMHNKAHVLFINTHPESGRRDNDIVARLAGKPFPLTVLAVEGAEASVIGRRADAVAPQPGGQRLAVLAKGSVDDAADGVEALASSEELGPARRVGCAAAVYALQPGDEVREVVGVVGGEADLVVQVAAGGSHGEGLKRALVEAEGGDDVVSDAPRGGRGQAHNGDLGDLAPEPDQFLVGGAEVVAPFGDAVGFVDGDAGELALRVDGLDVAAEGFGQAELGGDVEETGERVAAAEVVEDGFSLLGGSVAVDCGDGYVCCAEGGDLVVLFDVGDLTDVPLEGFETDH